MPQVKLFGLVLIITTLLVGMMVIVTGTFEIRIHRPGYSSSGLPPVGANQPGSQPTGSPVPGGRPQNQGPWQPGGVAADQAPQFITVPVAAPLAVAGVLGMLLWFAPGTPDPRKAAQRRQRSGQQSRSRRR